MTRRRNGAIVGPPGSRFRFSEEDSDLRFVLTEEHDFL
jgi:hypothetical protein